MDEGVDPQNMCHHLYGAMGILHELSSETSEELVVLFQDWLDMVRAECEHFIKENPGASTTEIARQLKLPEESVHFLLKRSGDN